MSAAIPTSVSEPQTHAGRTVVVTGAARGIGQALCVAFACRGAAAVIGIDVVSQETTGELVREAAPSTEWTALTVDVSREEQVVAAAAAATERHGVVDILVNNAAISDGARLDGLSTQRWREVLAVNLDGPFHMFRAFTPGMRERGWGRVVNISSGVVMNPMPGFVAYRSAKMGLIGLTRALATEVGNEGITVNVVSPGVTRTALADDTLDAGIYERAAQARAIQKIADPDDVTGVVLFASSEDCAFLTGQTLMANGGAYFL